MTQCLFRLMQRTTAVCGGWQRTLITHRDTWFLKGGYQTCLWGIWSVLCLVWLRREAHNMHFRQRVVIYLECSDILFEGNRSREDYNIQMLIHSNTIYGLFGMMCLTASCGQIRLSWEQVYILDRSHDGFPPLQMNIVLGLTSSMRSLNRNLQLFVWLLTSSVIVLLLCRLLHHLYNGQCSRPAPVQ